jgi:hypothetical protein
VLHTFKLVNTFLVIVFLVLSSEMCSSVNALSFCAAAVKNTLFLVMITISSWLFDDPVNPNLMRS